MSLTPADILAEFKARPAEWRQKLLTVLALEYICSGDERVSVTTVTGPDDACVMFLVIARGEPAAEIRAIAKREYRT